jgi:hemerythrin-like domain-containing protein
MKGEVVMKNTNTLQVLTHQHMDDRQKCLQIMKEINQKGNKEMVKKEILTFWNTHLKKHVDAEESVLIPFLAKHQFNHEYVNILRREHDTIRTLAQRIPLHDDGYYLYKAFLTLVDQHTYFENEIVFRKMQEDISAQELAQLDNSMRQAS